MLCCPMTGWRVSQYKTCCSLRTLGSSRTASISQYFNMDGPFTNWMKSVRCGAHTLLWVVHGGADSAGPRTPTTPAPPSPLHRMHAMPRTQHAHKAELTWR